MKELVEGKMIQLKLLKRDQYGRAIVVATIPKLFLFKQDVSIKLLEKGLAVVYRGMDACYGGNKKLYIDIESAAKLTKKGIWSQNHLELETPAEYKKSTKNRIN